MAASTSAAATAPRSSAQAACARTRGSARAPRRPGPTGTASRLVGSCHFLRDCPQLRCHCPAVAGLAEQSLDPGLAPVVLRHVVVDEEADRAGCRRGCRRTCGRRGASAGESTSLSISGPRSAAARRSSRSARRRAGTRSLRPVSRSASVGDHAAVDALAALAADPRAAALFFDVDGTLAPIVQTRRTHASPTRHARSSAASRHAMRLVACVSGRTGEMARAIVGVPELTYVGEHGLELDPEAQSWARAYPRLRRRCPLAGGGEATLGGVPLPDSRRPQGGARASSRQIAARARAAGFRTRWGRLVLEVLPPRRRVEAHRCRARCSHVRGCSVRSTQATTRPISTHSPRSTALELGVRIAVVSPESPAALSDARRHRASTHRRRCSSC